MGSALNRFTIGNTSTREMDVLARELDSERIGYFSRNSGLPLVYLAIMCKDPSFMESVLASDPPAPRGEYVDFQDVTVDDVGYRESHTVYNGGKISPH